jgi:Mg2+-importing ATPase
VTTELARGRLVADSLSPLSIEDAATRGADDVVAALGSTVSGLSAVEAAKRLATFGPNALRTHKANAWAVLARQLRSPILILLVITASISLFVGQTTDSIVIGVILIVSVGLGFANEYRAERASEALHSNIAHRAIAIRDGTPTDVNVIDLVPGDIVHLALGAVIPADIRLITCSDLLCDEGILTGESLPVEKAVASITAGAALGDLTSCIFMGTIIHSGSCMGIVVATGGRAEFGRIALGLSTRQPQTEFQQGLSRFSLLLLEIAVVLTALIFVANLLLHRPLLESLLFSLAIAVGITPQLLPAVVSTSLATGTRALARRKVLVKRLICIEDLGDMDVLVTDKTGTLTEGRISFTAALPAGPATGADEVFRWGLLATEVDYSQPQISILGQNPLDSALWDSSEAAKVDVREITQLDVIPFDHQRRMTSVLVRELSGKVLLVSKGSPEDVMARCVAVAPGALAILDHQYGEGARVVAVATRVATGLESIGTADEKDLTLAGFLVFVDPPKANAKDSLDQLASLGISVKIATGDNAKVAEKVCSDLGLESGGTLTGVQLDAMSDAELGKVVRRVSIFARVSPEQKARIIKLLRKQGRAVGYLGDGVNDALALHHADLGISVDSATDVAKDAADIILLDKDLGVLAQGVMEGRRIFSNTIKYVLMGTSSNFGNMFSAAVASVVLSFLPMLPGQILLNNLLYDSSQLAIPGDHVDREQLHAPSHWDIGFIRRFMLVFGPISSLFDFATFGLMIFVFHAAAGEFRAGWFIESLATQTLIIFAIRTRRVPFFRSRPSVGLLSAVLGVIAVGTFLPFSPLAAVLGFDPLPAPFFLALVGMIVVYLVLVELAKAWLFARPRPAPEVARMRGRAHRISRRAARFSSPATLPGARARRRHPGTRSTSLRRRLT